MMEAGSIHGEGSSVPERVILAPAPGKFRPVEAGDVEATSDGVRRGPPSRSSASSTATATPRRSAAPSAAGSWACWPRPASGCVRASRWPGSAWRTDAGGTGTAGRHVGSASPSPAGGWRSPNGGSPTTTWPRWSTPATPGSPSAPASRSGGVAGEGETTATLAIEAGAGRHQATPACDPADIGLLHRGHLHLRAAHPAHRRLRAGGPRACAAARSTSTPPAPASSTAWSPAPRWSPPAASGRCSSSAPRRSAGSSTPPTGARASSSATAPARSCSSPAPSRSLLSWDLDCDGSTARPARHPARRQPHARSPSRRVAAGDHWLKMEGKEVYRRAVRAIVESARDGHGDRPASTADDIALFVPHQANVRIIDGGAVRLGLPAGAACSSTSTATATPRPRRCPSPWPRRPTRAACSDGDLVLLSGFGAGMSWASAVVRWGPAR